MSSLPPVSASGVVLASRLWQVKCEHVQAESYQKGARLMIVTIIMLAMNTRMPCLVLCQIAANWWEHVVCHSFSQADWIENFRLSRDTFTYICDILKPSIMKHDT